MTKKQPSRRKAATKAELVENSIALILSSDRMESPLHCALLLNAQLESALVALLSSAMIDGETTRQMFEEGGTLGELSSCAKLAYTLGLIHKNVYRNAITLGRIRNRFAHSRTKIDFDDEVISNLCNNLLVVKKSTSSSSPVIDELAEKDDREFPTQSAQNRFITASMRSTLAILETIDSVKRPVRKPDP